MKCSPLLLWFAFMVSTSGVEPVEPLPDLTLPENSTGQPAAGKRVPFSIPDYAGTEVHSMLYLPGDWDAEWQAKGKFWPVIVEYTGNEFPTSGSTGKVEDAALGFGLTGGKFIWITLPFVSEDRQGNAVRWWGDEKATVEFAKKCIPRICKSFGGNTGQVFLCGFSRGAIGVNYIGLHDDEIAKLWRGFITHDHYDGVKEWRGTSWGSPLEKYRREAGERLARLKGRPVLVCQGNSVDANRAYLAEQVASLAPFTFLPVDVQRIFGEFPNPIAKHPHTDRWPLRDSPERRRAWDWFREVLAEAE